MKCPNCGAEVQCDHPDTFTMKTLAWDKAMRGRPVIVPPKVPKK